MKKYLLLFVVIGALVLALPGIVGWQMEARYQELVERAEQAGLRVTANSYQRGWFAAAAETELEPALPKRAADVAAIDMRFKIRSRIDHGPLVTAGLGLGEIDSEILVDGEQLFPDEYPASIKTLVALDGGGRMQLELPPLSLEPQSDRPAAEFSGLSAQLDFDPQFQANQLQAEMAGLVLSEGGSAVLEVGLVEMDSRSWAGPAGLTLGGGIFTMERLLFNNPAQDIAVALNGLSAEIESSDQGQQIGGSASYRLETAEIGGETYGPGEIRFEFSNFSAPVLARMQQEFEQMSQQDLSEQQQGMVVMSILLSSVPKLLENDPGLALRQLRLVTPDGVIEGHLALQSRGLKWEEIGDPAKLLGKLAADMSLRLPQRLLQLVLEQRVLNQIVQQYQQRESLGEEIEMPNAAQLQSMVEAEAEQQLSQLLGQGILEQDGDRLATVAVLADGLLTVNGKTVPLQMFQ